MSGVIRCYLLLGISSPPRGLRYRGLKIPTQSYLLAMLRGFNKIPSMAHVFAGYRSLRPQKHLPGSIAPANFFVRADVDEQLLANPPLECSTMPSSLLMVLYTCIYIYIYICKAPRFGNPPNGSMHFCRFRHSRFTFSASCRKQRCSFLRGQSSSRPPRKRWPVMRASSFNPLLANMTNRMPLRMNRYTRLTQ